MAVDLIGPWPVKIGNKDITFIALTIIDPVTNLTEIVRVDNVTVDHVARKFAFTWLSRYPWPENVSLIVMRVTGWKFQIFGIIQNRRYTYH